MSNNPVGRFINMLFPNHSWCPLDSVFIGSWIHRNVMRPRGTSKKISLSTAQFGPRLWRYEASEITLYSGKMRGIVRSEVHGIHLSFPIPFDLLLQLSNAEQISLT